MLVRLAPSVRSGQEQANNRESLVSLFYDCQMAKQQRSIRTREIVLTAAARQFARAGYQGTTLNAIVREANITQGALYFHFDSKHDLAAEVIRLQHEVAIESGKKFLEEQSGLVGMVRLSGELALQIVSDPIVQAGLRLSTEDAEELSDFTREPYTDWESMSKLFLQRAEKQHETREGLDVDAAAETVMSAFTGAQIVSAALSQSTDLLERLERLWPVLLGGIAADPHNPALSNISDLLRPTDR